MSIPKGEGAAFGYLKPDPVRTLATTLSAVKGVTHCPGKLQFDGSELPGAAEVLRSGERGSEAQSWSTAGRGQPQPRQRSWEGFLQPGLRRGLLLLPTAAS